MLMLPAPVARRPPPAGKKVACSGLLYLFIYRGKDSKIRKCTHRQIVLVRGSENGRKKLIVEDVLTRFLIFRAMHRNEMRGFLDFLVNIITAMTLYVKAVMSCMLGGLDNALDAVCLETV